MASTLAQATLIPCLDCFYTFLNGIPIPSLDPFQPFLTHQPWAPSKVITASVLPPASKIKSKVHDMVYQNGHKMALGLYPDLQLLPHFSPPPPSSLFQLMCKHLQFSEHVISFICQTLSQQLLFSGITSMPYNSAKHTSTMTHLSS